MGLTRDQGVVLAKRSISLSKTYAATGTLLACLSVFAASLTKLESGLGSGGPLFVEQSVSLISVPFGALAALIFTQPVLMLFVYDKNNGVLEYLLSLGKDQGDVYKQYLKAAIILSSAMVAFEAALHIAVGYALGVGSIAVFLVVGLVVAIAIPVVSFTTLAMMAFSSLQKQRAGSNQPLGLTLGSAAVVPSYVAFALGLSEGAILDVTLAATVSALAFLMYFFSSRLIRRENFLP